MTNLLISKIFKPYHISSEKDFDTRRSYFPRVSGVAQRFRNILY